ncbi:hypothetical protein [Tumidithrix helvetica]
MLTFLFWNLNGKDLVPAIARLVAAHELEYLRPSVNSPRPTWLLG